MIVVAHKVVDGVVNPVLGVYGMRMDEVEMGFEQSEYEIDPKIQFDFDSDGGNCLLLWGIVH